MPLTQTELTKRIEDLFESCYDNSFEETLNNLQKDLDGEKIAITNHDARVSLNASFGALASQHEYEGLQRLVAEVDIAASFPLPDTTKSWHYEVLWGVTNTRIGSMESVKILLDAGFDISQLRRAESYASDTFNEHMKQFFCVPSETGHNTPENCVHDYKMTALFLDTGKIIGIDPDFGKEMAARIRTELSSIIGEGESENCNKLNKTNIGNLLEYVSVVCNHRNENFPKEFPDLTLEKGSGFTRLATELEKFKDRMLKKDLQDQILEAPSILDSRIKPQRADRASSDKVITVMQNDFKQDGDKSKSSTPEKVVNSEERTKPSSSANTSGSKGSLSSMLSKFFGSSK